VVCKESERKVVAVRNKAKERLEERMFCGSIGHGGGKGKEEGIAGHVGELVVLSTRVIEPFGLARI
jgi:hypothetical protein